MGEVQYFGSKQFMLIRRSGGDWLGSDFTTPMGPVDEGEFAGRWCWIVDLAPPPRKPYPIRIWVDRESGQLLGHRVEEAGLGAEFTEVVIDEDQRQQRAWFADAVAPAALTTRVPIDFTPDFVRMIDGDSGAFDAHNNRTALARRPRSAEGWAPEWGGVHYVWSTPDWDWCANCEGLDDEALAALQRGLHPGEPVDRQRRIG